ncbi:hypothetical protein [Acidithiobacillus ferriphilus]|uniref:hypothetical protein n=1 Tax=Acidithiobacillus ferriphilus TaxID=1689834 RepID=UPI001C06D8A3|nr:hypothetical protein [Acidithiobacillus ferriphilus]MBU2828631.1 hypothetical protein [Acidithiobacillus ferriphilus]
MSAEKTKTKIYVNQDLHEIETHNISYERVVELYLGEGGAMIESGVRAGYI